MSYGKWDAAFSACCLVFRARSPYFPDATRPEAATRQLLPVSVRCRTMCQLHNFFTTCTGRKSRKSHSSLLPYFLYISSPHTLKHQPLYSRSKVVIRTEKALTPDFPAGRRGLSYYKRKQFFKRNYVRFSMVSTCRSF